MKNKVVITIVIVAILLAGVTYYAVRQSGSDTSSDTEQAITEKKDGVMEDTGDSMMEKKEGSIPRQDPASGMVKFSGTVLAGTTSPLLDFNQADYNVALGSNKLVVLYFYANWCPICRRETQTALYPAFNKLSGDDVVGFRVSFNDTDTDDNEKKLAREFGVAYQHTKVFLKGGQRILKSPEEWDEDRYDREITSALP